jgi:CBS domain-containing protein
MRERPEHPLRTTIAIAERALRAADLATRDLWRVDPSWSCGEAAQRMTERDFDVAPVDETPLRRFVLRKELERVTSDESVDAAAMPIDATHVVTGDLGLADTLDLLGHREFVFVIEGNEVVGLITLSDLQRIPVGMAVLAIILATELGLNELIARRYGEWGFLAHLSEDRRRQVLERHEELRRRNLETSPIDALMLEERLTLVGKVQRFRRELGFPSRKRYESWTEELKRLRNALAHGNTLLDHQPDARRALELVGRVRSFAEAVWDLVERERVGGVPGAEAREGPG